jgi:hypothetical protein
MDQSTMRNTLHRPIRRTPKQTPSNICVLGLLFTRCLDKYILETFEQHSRPSVSGLFLEFDPADITKISMMPTTGDSYNTQLAVSTLLPASTSVGQTTTCHTSSPYAGQQRERSPVGTEEQQVDNARLEPTSKRQRRSLFTPDARKIVDVGKRRTKTQYGYRQ